jgi:polar amino acid transport system permease protein
MPDLQFGVVFADFDLLIRAAGTTALLWAAAFSVGWSAGWIIAFGRRSPRLVLAIPARGFVECFRNTPVLVQLIWFYYALPVLIGIQMPAFGAAVLALGLNGTAYCAEIHRNGLQSVAIGQWEAGRALGMGRLRVFFRIILPQAVSRMIPAYTNRAVEMAKNTSVASVISVHELMYNARLFSSQNYVPLETFTVVAGIYFVVIWPISLASSLIERRRSA